MKIKYKKFAVATFSLVISSFFIANILAIYL